MASTSSPPSTQRRPSRKNGYVPGIGVGPDGRPLRRPSTSTPSRTASLNRSAALQETVSLIGELRKQEQQAQAHPTTLSAIVSTGARVAIDFGAALEKGATARDVLGPVNTLSNLLDEVVKVHAFVAIAVAPFKVVLGFYMEGLQNDRRIAVLVNRMSNMMCAFEPLATSTTGSKFKTSHLKTTLQQMEKDISECGKAIDLYFKQKTIVKYIKAASWHEKMEDFAEIFANHKEQLNTLLSVTIQIDAEETKAAVEALDAKMELVLDLLRQPNKAEEEITSFLENQGGLERCISDDYLLSQLIFTAEGINTPKPRTRFHEPASPTQPVYQSPYVLQSGMYNSSGGIPTPFSPQGYANQAYIQPVHSAGPRNRYVQEAYTGFHVPIPPSHIVPPLAEKTRRGSIRGRRPSLTRRGRSNSPHRAETKYPDLADVPYSPMGSQTFSYPSPHKRSRSQSNGFRNPFHKSQQYYPPEPGYSSVDLLPLDSTRYPSDTHGNPAPRIVPAHESQEWLMQVKVEVRSAATTDLQIMLHQNTALWNLKFDHQTRSLQRTVELNTSRVLAVLQSGPHERLREPHMRDIWQAEKWRGSVTGAVFLQAVQDYYWTRFEDLTLRSGRVPQVAWTVNFLGTPYRGALLEVIDVDQSGFVSIPETARFTDMKPRGWSLPVWFAYMAVRWSFEAAHYKTTLTTLFDLMEETLEQLDFSNPNREQVSTYMSNAQAWIKDTVLLTLNVPVRRYDDARKNDTLMDLLNRGMKEREQHMQKKLQSVRWEIDGPAALAAIAGDGPVEQWLLPLLHVLLQQHQRILAMSTKYTLDARELGSAWASITQILIVLNTRVLYLLDCVQSQHVVELFGDFACGLFAAWPWSSFPTPVLVEAEPELPVAADVTSQENGQASQRSSSEATVDVLRFPSGAVLNKNNKQKFQPVSIMKPPAHGPIRLGGPIQDDHSSDSHDGEHHEGKVGDEVHSRRRHRGLSDLFKGLFAGKKRDPNKEYLEEISRQINPEVNDEE